MHACMYNILFIYEINNELYGEQNTISVRDASKTTTF